MASRELYSPNYDSDGNVKPSIPELANAIENARLDAKGSSQKSRAARDDALTARDEALGAANDLGTLGGVDGTAESKVDANTIREADGTDVEAPGHSGEIWYVVGETAYYKSNGTDWIKTGPDLSDADRLTKGSLPKQTIPQSALDAGHIVATVEGAEAEVVRRGTFSDDESAIDDAITYAATSGAANTGVVRLPPSAVPYDESVVSFDPSVRMEVQGYPVGVHSAAAYGAVGDGNADDYAALQAAFDGANALGEAAHLPEGTYRKTGKLLLGTGAKGLIGEGEEASRIVEADPSNTIMGDLGSNTTLRDFAISHDISSNSDYNSGRGLYINSGGTPIDQDVPHTNIHVRRVTFEDMSSQAIAAYGGLSFSSFTNVTVRRAGRAGIVTNTARYCIFSDCFIGKTGDDGIAINVTSIGNVVANNVFKRAGGFLPNDTVTPNAAGVKVHGQGNVVTDNTFVNCFQAIHLKESAGVSSQANSFTSATQNVISDNLIRGLAPRNQTEQAAIYLNSAGEVELKDNVVYAVHENGNIQARPLVVESCSDLSLSGNRWYGRGIRLNLGNSPKSNVKIHDDTFVTLSDSTDYWSSNKSIDIPSSGAVTITNCRFLGSQNLCVNGGDGCDVHLDQLHVFPSQAEVAYLGSDLASGDTITGLPLDVNLKKARNSGLAVNLSDGQRITLWDTVNEVRETVTVDGAQSAGNQKSSISISSHTLSNSFADKHTAIVLERDSSGKYAFLSSTNASTLKSLYLGRLLAREGTVDVRRTLYTSGYSVTEDRHADVMGAPSSQPSLQGVEDGSWRAWIDEANSELVFEVKDTSGATLSGTVSLS
jgi:hypothetical protein